VDISVIFYAVVALVSVGGGWLIASYQHAQQKAEQLAEREEIVAELSAAKQQIAQSAHWRDECELLNNELRNLRDINTSLEADLREVTTRLESTQLHAEDKIRQMMNSEQRLSEQFENLANRIFEQLKQSALDFHEFPVPGKIQVSPTKPLATQRDLALAYSPGVAAPCLEIEKDPLAAYKYTARGNLVAVISNGTAVLGLGNIGALAGKPVMEGKGVLFKKFAGIDVFDIEVDETDPDKFINVVAALEPTFGGINLEDIKAPECFYIEQKLRERMNIPVFHDDQHGTAIISTAAILNGLRVVEKNISDVRMVVSGAGAAAIACMNLLVALGMQKHNIVVCDSKGVIYKDREPNMAETKAAYAVVDDGKRTLDDVIDGADIFLGCSGPKVLTQEMVKKMARAPMILALANPEPEILPPLAKEVRADAIICTGRSDYPNQVNNVLCFPFIFRGALDVGATAINEEMVLSRYFRFNNAHFSRSPTSRLEKITNVFFLGLYTVPAPIRPFCLLALGNAIIFPGLLNLQFNVPAVFSKRVPSSASYSTVLVSR
jgi:malate dehydrogenase (oxaloacetate-decarboxylating)(NADP+)